MNSFGFTLLTAGLFVAGFGGTYYAVNSPGLFASAVAVADCDPHAADCRARLRSQGERAFARGDVATGDAAYAKAALGGDVRAAFLLGWHHEEAYRRAVGKKLEAGTAPLEEGQPGIGGLPRGPEFLALTRHHEAVPPGPARPLADRTLAFLWYGHAATGGFGPAMNNLGAMYQFGLMGARDRVRAQTWYERAAAVQNPVGRLNLRVLSLRYGADCDFDSPMAFAAGLTAPPVDLEEEIIVRTRFRGRAVPSALRGLFEAQSLAVSKPPDEMGVVDVLRIAGAANSFDVADFAQDWDDADEVEAARGKQRDCAERRSASRDHDREKMQRLRSLQDSIDRPTVARRRL